MTTIRVELLKLRTGRMPLALLALAAGMTALIAVIQSARAGGNGSVVPSLATHDGIIDIVTNTGFGRLIAAVLGITVASGEFRYSTATDTYLDEPNRTTVLAAKAVAAAVAGAFFGLVAAIVATGAALGYVGGAGYGLALGAGRIAKYAGGSVLGAALMAAVGVGLGSLVRNQIAAIIAVFAWVLAVEQLIGAVSDSIAAYLPITAASTVAGATSKAAMPPVPSLSAPLSFAAATALLTGIAVALLVLAARTTAYRDIT